MLEAEIEKIELSLLLNGIESMYGYDFRGYSHSSMLRRVRSFKGQKSKNHISELLVDILHKEDFFVEFIEYITVQHSSLFRNPSFFQTLKSEVFSSFDRSNPIKIWIAGCANGEEVYSMVILLHEMGLLENVDICATDISPKALSLAKNGVLKYKINSEDIKRYNDAGGEHSLSDYFVQAYGKHKIKSEFLEKVTFANHNLAQDGVFMSADLILCRNIMIYFNASLQEHVYDLLDNSLINGGFLGIGADESLNSMHNQKEYRAVRKLIKIYKKEE